jgi:type III secretory pathway component EscV
MHFLKMVVLTTIVCSAFPPGQTPSQHVLTKIGQLADSWVDHFIADVLSRENRAASFKNRIARVIKTIDERYVSCQSKLFEGRRKRRNANRFEKSLSSGMFDTTSGRQLKQLSHDPERSNSQIFINLLEWVAENMNDCTGMRKHQLKIKKIGERWMAIFKEVLNKITVSKARKAASRS